MKIIKEEEVGLKDSDNKIMYEELDWKFIEGMALKMTKAKSKYPAKNWQKPIDKEQLIAACQRHLSEVWKGDLIDKEDGLHHLFAVATNAMMMYYQLENNK